MWAFGFCHGEICLGTSKDGIDLYPEDWTEARELIRGFMVQKHLKILERLATSGGERGLLARAALRGKLGWGVQMGIGMKSSNDDDQT